MTQKIMTQKDFVEKISKEFGILEKEVKLQTTRWSPNIKDYRRPYDIIRENYTSERFNSAILGEILDFHSNNIISFTSRKKPSMDTQEGTPPWYQ